MSGIMNKLRHNQGTAPVNSNLSSVNSVEASGIQQRTIVDAPIVQETVRNDRVIEVQPVLHREVDQNIVHHIEKHIQEQPAPNMGGVIERNPLVQQNIHTNVVNEIQPIIHRERVVPVAERVEQHLTQRVVEPTVHTHEVVYESAPLNNNLNSFSNVNSAPPLTNNNINSFSNVNSTTPMNTNYATVNNVPPMGYSTATSTQSSKHGLFHRH